jgi:hypothetical protein
MWTVGLLVFCFVVVPGCKHKKKKTPSSEQDLGFEIQDPDIGSPEDVAAEVMLDTATGEDSYEQEVSTDVPIPVDVPPRESCNFGYNFAPWEPPLPGLVPPPQPDWETGPDRIAHLDPLPPYTFLLPVPGARDELVMPGYSDNMPLFDRARDWNGETRCYETPNGVDLLSEEEAWQLYRDIAEKTTGVAMDTAPGVRSVVGLRGAYPGTFAWHGNMPNRFNDTLVLLWRDDDGLAHVKEFAAHTDTGPYDFGWHNSSSLKPDRRYRYINGWHKDYNALKINEWSYEVRDDANKNGHWDSDRNNWLPPLDTEDHDRTGSAHNIHMASVNGPLYQAEVHNWSAGCQVIPGMSSWTEFVTNAWTGTGDFVDYFLIDVRDIDPVVWAPCQPDGSHQCPFHIDSFPYTASGDTSQAVSEQWDSYNCSAANEAGPEEVYVLTLDEPATIFAAVDDNSDLGPDIDIHLLYGNSPDACLIRDNLAFSIWVPPGRYYVAADTYVEAGQPLAGPYVLDVWLEMDEVPE